jgi:hypothetical protein
MIELAAAIVLLLVSGGIFASGYALRGRLAAAQLESKDHKIEDQRERMTYLRKALAEEIAAAQARAAGASVDYDKLEKRLAGLADPDPSRRIKRLLQLFPLEGISAPALEQDNEALAGGSDGVADAPEV